MSRLSSGDPSSFSEPENLKTRHIDLFWNVDFVNKCIRGEALLHFDIDAIEIDQILLDVRDLRIDAIAVQIENVKIPVDFTVSDDVKEIGAKLTIKLPSKTSRNVTVSITYATSPSASGLQWLRPEQTCGKLQPYMYSQWHAIHARSIFPCQDTGAVKFTFNAEVTHPIDLTALMSAVRMSDENGKTVFEQTVPIAPYLLAIAVGPLVSRTIGPISKVWCEEELVDACAEEFSETSEMLTIAEKLCGPYEWKVYDILVLPPNFPFGGMENPCLTFLTPTLLAGDKSLANVVAHEISHSWTGNLVTNKNFEHFWVNEGFTEFLEGKIYGRMFGTAARDFLAIRDITDLQDCFDNQLKDNPEMTKLVVDLTGVNPDDTYSLVPYVKGQNFLRYLEDLLGGPTVFEPFFRHYIQKYKYKSVDSDDVKTTLHEYFGGKADDELAQIDWNLWLYGEGGIPVMPNYDTSWNVVVQEQVDIWVNNPIESIRNNPGLKRTGLHVWQLVELLAKLLQNPAFQVTQEWVQQLEETYGLVGTKNCEFLLNLCRLYIKGRLADRLDQVIAFANSNFRIRYVRPIYRALNGWPEARPRAVANFLSVKDQMMHSVALNIYKDLSLELVA